MDNVTRYRHIIRELIQQYAQHRPACGEVQIEVIFDETNDHYELMYAGWNGPYRIHGSVLHIDIRQEKVWIQYDGTEDGGVGDLPSTKACAKSSGCPSLTLALQRHI